MRFPTRTSPLALCSFVLLAYGCSNSSTPPLDGTSKGNTQSGQPTADAATATPDAATSIDSGTTDVDASDASDTTADTGPVVPIDAGFDAATLYFDGAACDANAYSDPSASCGGPGCTVCQAGETCNYPEDCSSKVCSSAIIGGPTICQAASCTDGVENGNETDVDCGGNVCPACGTGEVCKTATDCLSLDCVGSPSGASECATATCTDGIQNEGESDVNCGGPCPSCELGKKCGLNADCSSDTCGSPETPGLCVCPGLPHRMTLIPQDQTLGGDYCIDDYEVNIGSYYQFRAAGPTLSDLPTYCRSSVTNQFAPNPAAPPAITDSQLPNYNAENPQQGVSWCEAYSYCSAQSPTMHLCGSTRHGGSSNPTSQATDAGASRWFNACSSNGSLAYPYGASYNANFCLGADDYGINYAAGLEDGGTLIWPDTLNQGSDIPEYATFCQYADVFDMSGNVAEWEDSCSSTLDDGGVSADASENDTCLVRGGSYLSNANGLACAAIDQRPRTDNSLDLGFRCCFP